MKELSGKVCLLTGASGGIGVEVARRLAAEGMHLALVARREEPLRVLAGELTDKGVTAAVFACDLTDADALDGLVADVEATLGPVAVLVNNAGVETFQHYAEADRDGIARAVQLNLTAPLLLTRRVLPGMLERGDGHVVSIASTAGLVGTAYGVVYGATKAGVITASNSLRMEFADAPVGFSAICPGFVHGGGMHELHKDAIGNAPAMLGGTTTRAVADAVLAAIRDDRAEPIVNSAPFRPLVGLGRAIPSLANWLLPRLDGGYLRRLADHRRRDTQGAA